jgi:hypothetical protein
VWHLPVAANIYILLASLKSLAQFLPPILLRRVHTSMDRQASPDGWRNFLAETWRVDSLGVENSKSARAPIAFQFGTLNNLITACLCSQRAVQRCLNCGDIFQFLQMSNDVNSVYSLTGNRRDGELSLSSINLRLDANTP